VPLGAFGFALRRSAQLLGVMHVVPLQSRVAQSPLAPHGVPEEHAGEHAGAGQTPLLHRPEPQSAFAPQPLPSAHDGEQLGTAHLPAVQTPEAQSEFAPHATPS